MAQVFHVNVDTHGHAWTKRADSAVRTATRYAGVSAQRAMYAEGSRKVRERKAMKVAFVREQIKMLPSYKSAYVWAVKASGLPVPVMAFSPKQTARGRKVKGGRGGTYVTINVGKRVLIRSAFIATMKSGHQGVFMRYGTASRVPIQRYRGHGRYAGQRRQPIRELYTTTVADAFKDAIPDIAKRGREVFEHTFKRVVRAKLEPGQEFTAVPVDAATGERARW